MACLASPCLREETSLGTNGHPMGLPVERLGPESFLGVHCVFVVKSFRAVRLEAPGKYRAEQNCLRPPSAARGRRNRASIRQQSHVSPSSGLRRNSVRPTGCLDCDAAAPGARFRSFAFRRAQVPSPLAGIGIYTSLPVEDSAGLIATAPS